MNTLDRAVQSYALHRANDFSAPTGTGPDAIRVRRRRAAVARQVSAMLSVHPAHVVVTDRSDSHHGEDLVIVIDPHDPEVTLSYTPEPGGNVLYLLLGDCPSCNGEVPLATIETLIDLGNYFDAIHAPDGDPSEQCPIEFFNDSGHLPTCDLGHA